MLSNLYQTYTTLYVTKSAGGGTGEVRLGGGKRRPGVRRIGHTTDKTIDDRRMHNPDGVEIISKVTSH